MPLMDNMSDAEWLHIGYSIAPVNGHWVHGTAYKAPYTGGGARYWDAGRNKWLDDHPGPILSQGWLFDD